MIERVGTANVYARLPKGPAEAALETMVEECDILGLNEWGPQRNDIAHKVDGWLYRKPAAGCPPLLVRDSYRFLSARVVTLARGRYVGVIPGRKSRLDDNHAGLYTIEAPDGARVAVLNWHLPATVEARGVYRRIASMLSPRARMHREARRKGRRMMRRILRTGKADRAYIIGDTNYHDMQLRGFVSCWQGHRLQGTHGKRTIDIIHASVGKSARVQVFRLGTRLQASDHRGVVATYEVAPMSGHSAEKDAPVVLDLDDPYFHGQSLPDVLRDYVHVHSATGVCVKAPGGRFCRTRVTLSGKEGSS